MQTRRSMLRLVRLRRLNFHTTFIKGCCSMESLDLTVSKHPTSPLYPTRLVNFVGKLQKPIVLEPEELCETACRSAKLDDWGDHHFEIALEAFCTAINDDGKMHSAGKVYTRKGILMWLGERLQIQDTLTRIPQIVDEPVFRPILIPGEPRSGTTFIHRLLALDPQFRTPRSWELYFPTPPPNPATDMEDPRVSRTRKLYQTVYKTCPGLEVAHPMEATLPEECWHLLDRSFVRPLLALYNDIPGYTEWLLSRPPADLADDYRYYKTQLQILQWHFSEPRWILKSPVHGFFLDAYHAVFPDVTCIHCHRDPVEVLPSLCSLVAARQSAFYDAIDFRQVRDNVLYLFKTQLNRVLEARAHIGTDRFFDLSFTAVMKAPLETVADLYRRLGLELTPEVKSWMQDFITTPKIGDHTRHRYTLEQFGFDQATIERAFAPYREQFSEFI